MTKRPTSIADAMAKKAVVQPPEPVHDQLREISFTTRRSQHDLLMEGLNLVFERFGKPPIAPRD
jgi:hypothetical protein